MYINLNHYKIHTLIFNDKDLEDGRNIILIPFFKVISYLSISLSNILEIIIKNKRYMLPNKDPRLSSYRSSYYKSFSILSTIKGFL